MSRGVLTASKFTIKKVTIALDELKQELAKQKAQMTMLRDVHTDIENMARLNTQRENITSDIA